MCHREEDKNKVLVMLLWMQTSCLNVHVKWQTSILPYTHGGWTFVKVIQMNSYICIVHIWFLMSSASGDAEPSDLYMCTSLKVSLFVFADTTVAVSLSGENWCVQHRGLWTLYQSAQRRHEEYLTRDSSQPQSCQGWCDSCLLLTIRTFMIIWEMCRTWRSVSVFICLSFTLFSFPCLFNLVGQLRTSFFPMTTWPGTSLSLFPSFISFYHPNIKNLSRVNQHLFI